MTDVGDDKPLTNSLLDALDTAGRVADAHQGAVRVEDIGTVQYVGSGIAQVRGLADAHSEEVVRFPGGESGMVFNLDPDEVGVILLDSGDAIYAGDEVHRTGRILETPVGDSLLGRVVDPLGRPLDGREPLEDITYSPVEREAPGVVQRAPVTTPLQTGITVIGPADRQDRRGHGCHPKSKRSGRNLHLLRHWPTQFLRRQGHRPASPQRCVEI